jgi:hypothetical protein
MMRFTLGACIAATLACQTTSAHAARCDSYAVRANQSGSDSYDPAQVLPALVTVSIAAIEQTEQGCLSAQVTLASIDGRPIELVNGATRLTGRLVRSNRVGNLRPEEVSINGNGRNDIIDGGLELDFLEVDPGQFVPAGTYRADLNVTVGDAAPVPFSVELTVQPSMRFVDTGMRDLSLGEVSNGSSVSSNFAYRTNAMLSVVARSDNGGTLLHEQGSAYGRIPYRARLGGEALDLQTPTPIIIPLTSTGVRMDSLLVEVDPQTGRYAGRYRDTLTLEFTAF